MPRPHLAWLTLCHLEVVWVKDERLKVVDEQKVRSEILVGKGLEACI